MSNQTFVISKLSAFALFFSLCSCEKKNTKAWIFPAIPEIINAENFIKLKSIIDNQIPKDTLYANKCNAPIDENELINAMLAEPNKSNQNFIAKKDIKTKAAPCNGQILFIGDYKYVSLVKLGRKEEFRIIASSFHDQEKNGSDFILMKINSSKYAYNRGHICGSIQIPYTKDSITIRDILNEPLWDSSWHIIAENNEH